MMMKLPKQKIASLAHLDKYQWTIEEAVQVSDIYRVFFVSPLEIFSQIKEIQYAI